MAGSLSPASSGESSAANACPMSPHNASADPSRTLRGSPASQYTARPSTERRL